jgi:cytochrome c
MIKRSLLIALVPLAGCGESPPDPQAAVAACTSCHSLKPGEPSRAGPNLAGVLGRKAGALPGFAYSPAMKASGVVWDRDTLDRFLARPNDVVPGNRMSFAGVSQPAKRAAIIEYLAAPK